MKKYLIAPCEEWVKKTECVSSRTMSDDSPFYFLLVDYQERINDEQISFYKRTVEKVNDGSRIEDASLYLYGLKAVIVLSMTGFFI